MNKELFKKVYDVIQVDPSHFGMDTWEETDASCGTTRCLAGWGIFLTTGQPLWDPEAGFNGIHPSVKELAGNPDMLDIELDFDKIGGELLGLGIADHWVFYTTSGKAREFARLASEGKFDEARALRSVDPDEFDDF